MMITTAVPPRLVEPPDLSAFTVYYGVPVTALGDDGDTFIALGVHEPRRALAAWNRMCREDLGYRWSLYGPAVTLADVRHQRWVLAVDCGAHSNNPDCVSCAAIRAADWWLRPARPDEPDQFAVTVHYH